MLEVDFHALQRPCRISCPSSRSSTMVSRIPRKWLNICQLTLTKFFEIIVAHSSHRRY